jgi:hypothetical protein
MSAEDRAVARRLTSEFSSSRGLISSSMSGRQWRFVSPRSYGKRSFSSLRDATGEAFRRTGVAQCRWRAPYWRRSSVSPIGTHRTPTECQPHPITRGIAPPISRHTHECHVRTSNTTAAGPVVRVPSRSACLARNLALRAWSRHHRQRSTIHRSRNKRVTIRFVIGDEGCFVVKDDRH